MTARSKVWIAVILGAAVAAAAVYRHNRTAQPVAEQASEPVVPVMTVPVRVAPIADRMTSYGNLVPARSVEIVPDRPGQVQKILFKDGQRVAAGTPLVVMNSQMAEAQVQASKAQAEADQQNLQRTQSLAHQGLDSTYSLEQARSRAAASEAQLAINREKLEQLTLKAPFSGTLGTRFVDAGAFVNAGQKIVRLDNTNRLKIEFRMPSLVIPRVSQGMAVHVAVPTGGRDLAVEGKLSFIDPAVSTDTRSVLLRAMVPNAEHRLRPGLYVRVTLDLDSHPHALVVPAEAVLRTLGGAYLYVVDATGIAHRRDVTLGLSDGIKVEVASGVKAGEQVVTVGQFRLEDGDHVRIVTEPAAAKGSS